MENTKIMELLLNIGSAGLNLQSYANDIDSNYVDVSVLARKAVQNGWELRISKAWVYWDQMEQLAVLRKYNRFFGDGVRHGIKFEDIEAAVNSGVAL